MTLRSLLVLILALAFAVAPLLASPFTGYAPDFFPVVIDRPAIQPAGYAFSIWLLIYLVLIAHGIIGFWRRAKSMDWDETRLPLATSLGLGVIWLWVAPHSPLIAAVMIVVMLLAALAAFLAADEFYDRWSLAAPLAVYAGWLSAASAVLIGVLLAGYGLLSNTDAALAMLGVILALAGVVQSLRPEMPAYGATVIWALLGIVVANATSNLFVALAAAGVAALLAALLFWQYRGRRSA